MNEADKPKKRRTNRTVLEGDFGDHRIPTSFDWPMDVYIFAKLLARSRGKHLYEITVEAMREYLTTQPELAELFQEPE